VSLSWKIQSEPVGVAASIGTETMAEPALKSTLRFSGLAAVLALWLGLPAAAPAQLETEAFVSGLTLPVGWVQDPIDPSVQYVLEQGGRIRSVRDGILQPTDLLDLTASVGCCGERGLLGLAFPPDHDVTGRFYVNFTNLSGDTVVARFNRSALDPTVADPSSRFDLRWPSGDAFIDQPFANHNAGHLAFGPDGYLYVALGDGGSANDPGHRAQNPDILLGKMLRIDVSVPDGDPVGYAVPADNPFVDDDPVAALDEIWSFGLRNPWRFSFDEPRWGGTGALVIGDVGQGSWEEIDYEPANRGGRNYGWRNREGAHDNIPLLPPAYLPLVDPVHEYDHSVGGSVTGGHVYRGGALPSRFLGRYFFADYVNGRVWSIGLELDPAGEATRVDQEEHTAELGGLAVLGNISSIGVDDRGELYLVGRSTGAVRKVVASSTPGDLFVDFGSPLGIWALIEGAGWIQAHALGSERMATGDPDGNGRDDIVVDFGEPYGIWIWVNGSRWTQLHGLSSLAMVTGDLDGGGQDEIVIDFGGPYGVWIWRNNASWTQLHPLSPEAMVTGDLDGNGQDEVVIDFGPAHGIWIRENDASWAQLHPLSSGVMATGDLDGSGQDEVVIDFGPPYGIWTRRNNAGWSQLHPLSSEAIVIGDLDGGGRDEAVIDFGSPYGLWSWENDASWAHLHETSPDALATGELRGP
jgi:glucose/arabinose dehydrogenase